VNPELADPENIVVLAIDDDRNMRRALRAALSGMGFTVLEAGRGEEALALVRVTWVDAVLLDVDMPGMGGIEACRSLRHTYAQLPILILTVMDSEDEIVRALDAGADDYITKPFQLRELAARLRSAVRRRSAQNGNRDGTIRLGPLELDPGKYLVKKHGHAIHLTPKEFEMLHYLMMHAGEPIPHARLLKSVWGPQYGHELEYLRTYVRQLRKKIEDDPRNPRYLLTEPYVGYRFKEDISASESTTSP
jgi:two-component system KDP operon response regulator KdpE